MATSEVLMVEPTFFRFEEGAAEDNAYMTKSAMSIDRLREVTMREFNGLVSALESEGVVVHHFPSEEGAADAVFPNNWFSALRVGDEVRCTLYPMKNAARRLERENRQIRQFLRERYGEADDFVHYEAEEKMLEGTGSMVLDRANRIVYVALSERSDGDVAQDWADKYHYRLVVFEAKHLGVPIYHTNVMMALGENVAVVALDSVVDNREELESALRETGKHIVQISKEQINEFCGNVLELTGTGGQRLLAMSERAFNGFTGAQREELERCGLKLVHADISNLENVGGGSVRCMIAELL